MNYEQSQFLVKLLITAVIVVPVAWGIVKLWQKDVDVAKFFNVRKTVEESANKRISWIPERESDAIYQNGKLVAKVSEAVVDEANGVVIFREVYQSNDLNLDTAFEFRRRRLGFKSAETITGLRSDAPHKGRIIENVTCIIKGTR